MPLRFICPYCHSPVDPHAMDAARANDTPLRICPDCDRPVVCMANAMMPGARTTPSTVSASSSRPPRTGSGTP